jgi:Tfp pilus assembly protein PilF
MSRKKTSSPQPPVRTGWYSLLLLLLVMAVYGRTAQFPFVLDDELFIGNNPVVQQGFSGIPAAFDRPSLEHFKGSNFQMYRPALITAFCIERSLFGTKPQLYHVVNILLYAATVLLVFRLARKLLPGTSPLVAWCVAALYAVHPVHTEAVANVKGQDELWAALGALSSLYLFLRHKEQPDRSGLLYGSLGMFLLALFSKESSVAFFAVFPVTLFVIDRRPLGETLVRSLPWLAAAAFFLLCRQAVLHGVRQDYETTVIENSLYGAGSVAEKYATVFSILLNNWKLLVWPHPLSWDYSFNEIPLVGWTSPRTLLSVSLYTAAVVSSVVLMRRRPVFSWGMIFFLILLLPTSNLFFLNGTTYAERFLFLPSAGIMIAAASWLTVAGGKVKSVNNFKLLLPVLILIVIGGSVSASRCTDWASNLSLFESGVRNAPNSSRTQMALATEYMNRAQKSAVLQEQQELVIKSKQCFRKALEIFPENATAAYKLGLIEAMTGDTAAAVSLYRRAILHKPDDVFSLVNLATLYSSRAMSDSALFYLRQSFRSDSLNDMTLTNLMVVHFNRGEDAEVLRYGSVAERNNRLTPKISDLLARSRSRMGGYN